MKKTQRAFNLKWKRTLENGARKYPLQNCLMVLKLYISPVSRFLLQNDNAEFLWEISGGVACLAILSKT